MIEIEGVVSNSWKGGWKKDSPRSWGNSSVFGEAQSEISARLANIPVWQNILTLQAILTPPATPLPDVCPPAVLPRRANNLCAYLWGASRPTKLFYCWLRQNRIFWGGNTAVWQLWSEERRRTRRESKYPGSQNILPHRHYRLDPPPFSLRPYRLPHTSPSWQPPSSPIMKYELGKKKTYSVLSIWLIKNY